MIDYLEATHGFARAAAYALCSASPSTSAISEVVDVPYPLVSALLPLDVFERRAVELSRAAAPRRRASARPSRRAA